MSEALSNRELEYHQDTIKRLEAKNHTLFQQVEEARRTLGQVVRFFDAEVTPSMDEAAQIAREVRDTFATLNAMEGE